LTDNCPITLLITNLDAKQHVLIALAFVCTLSLGQTTVSLVALKAHQAVETQVTSARMVRDAAGRLGVSDFIRCRVKANATRDWTRCGAPTAGSPCCGRWGRARRGM
jgi:hypothetical protein